MAGKPKLKLSEPKKKDDAAGQNNPPQNPPANKVEVGKKVKLTNTTLGRLVFFLDSGEKSTRYIELLPWLAGSTQNSLEISKEDAKILFKNAQFQGLVDTGKVLVDKKGTDFEVHEKVSDPKPPANLGTAGMKTIAGSHEAVVNKFSDASVTMSVAE